MPARVGGALWPGGIAAALPQQHLGHVLHGPGDHDHKVVVVARAGRLWTSSGKGCNAIASPPFVISWNVSHTGRLGRVPASWTA